MSAAYEDLYSLSRSFISPASFYIFNRVCDTLVLLVIAHAHYYPDQPFCPWQYGTEFVEHFFGLARQILPNFTYAELLKVVQHVMVRQRILLGGNFKENWERNSGVGYILDFDCTPLTADEIRGATVDITDSEINELVELACKEASLICKQLLKIPAALPKAGAHLQLVRTGNRHFKVSPKKSKDDCSDEEEEDLDDDFELEEDEELTLSETAALAAKDVARCNALDDDYEATAQEVSSAPKIQPLTHPAPSATLSPQNQKLPSSHVLDGHDRVSIAQMILSRRKLQSGTTTKSECIVTMRVPKSAITDITAVTDPTDDNGKRKIDVKEANQRARSLQALAVDMERETKARELRWTEFRKKLATMGLSEQSKSNFVSV